MLAGARAGRTFGTGGAGGERVAPPQSRYQGPCRRVRRIKNSARATSGIRSQGHTAASRSPGARERPPPDACLGIGCQRE